MKSFQSRWVLGLSIFTLTAASYAQWTNPGDDVPAYHSAAPLKVSALPHILSGKDLTGPNFQYAWQLHTYQKAAKVGSVLYQLPCFCHCDRSMGHTSLRSCFEGLHGSECDVCSKEAVFAYEQTMAGKKPADIRAAILRHEYLSVDLSKQ
jgi:hypothetical protein